MIDTTRLRKYNGELKKENFELIELLEYTITKMNECRFKQDWAMIEKLETKLIENLGKVIS